MMRTTDAFLAALENLASHKLRSALTMLGMMFGVGAVISMLSIGAGAEQQAMDLIDRMGVRNVIVRAKDFEKEDLLEIRKKSIGVSQRDVHAIEEAVPGLEYVVPRLEVDAYAIHAPGGKTEAKVFGVSPVHAELTQLAGQG